MFHSLEKVEGDHPDRWRVNPGDGPSPGAWAMLVWASSNRDNFYSKLIPYLMKTTEPVEDPAEIREENKTLAEIETIISGVI